MPAKVSFTNWILGGSLVSVTSSEGDSRRRRSSGRKVVVKDIESDSNEAAVKEVESPKMEQKKDVQSAGEAEPKKKDDDPKPADESKAKIKCECCARGEGCPGEKKSEKTKSDESKDQTDNGSGGDKNDFWTEERDSKIKEMKEAGKSWKEIALEVGASKGDVTKRFKELQSGDGGTSKGNEKPSEDSGEGAQNTDSGSGNTGQTQSTENSGSNNSGGINDMDGSGWASGALNTEGSGWGNSGEAQSNGFGDPDFTDLFGTSDNPPDQGQENQEQKSNESNKKKSKKHDKGGSPGVGSQDRGGVDSGWNNKQSPSLHQTQPQGRLQANDIWSREDCEVLEMLESRYREHKWLHIQAGFFNWTGRMVVGELIERKFLDDGAA